MAFDRHFFSHSFIYLYLQALNLLFFSTVAWKKTHYCTSILCELITLNLLRHIKLSTLFLHPVKCVLYACGRGLFFLALPTDVWQDFQIL